MNMQQQYRPFPLITTFITATVLLSAYLNIAYDGLATKMLSCDVSNVLSYKLWVIVSSCLMEPAVGCAGLLLLVGWRWMGAFERRNGTIVLFVTFFTYGGSLTLLLLFWELIEYLAGVSWASGLQKGLLGVWINLMFKYCYFNADNKVRVCFFPIYIPLHLYPYILFLASMLLSGGLRLDGLLGLMLAMFECYYLNNGMVSYTKDTYTAKESYAAYVKLSSCGCWCPIDADAWVLNDFMMLPESQFYEDLYNWKPLQAANMDMDDETPRRMVKDVVEQTQQ